MKTPLAGIKKAARDAETRLGRDGLKADILRVAKGSVDTESRGEATHCSLGSGRGPVIAWTVRDGEPDPAAGIVLTLDISTTSGDFDLIEYHYDLDGRFRHVNSVDFSAIFR